MIPVGQACFVGCYMADNIPKTIFCETIAAGELSEWHNYHQWAQKVTARVPFTKAAHENFIAVRNFDTLKFGLIQLEHLTNIEEFKYVCGRAQEASN